MKHHQLSKKHHDFFKGQCRKIMDMFCLNNIFIDVRVGGCDDGCDANACYSHTDASLTVWIQEKKISKFYDSVYHNLVMLAFHEVVEGCFIGRLREYAIECAGSDRKDEIENAGHNITHTLWYLFEDALLEGVDK